MKTLYVLLHFLQLDSIIDKGHIRQVLNDKFTEYGQLLFGIVLGIIILYLYHRFVGNKQQRESYERIITQLEENISGYKELLLERLDNVTVDPVNKGFFKKVRRYFRNQYNSRKK